MNETILATIVGGIIASVGSIAGSLLQSRIEEHRTKRENRRKAYICAIKYCKRIGTSDMFDFPNETKNLREDAKIGLFLYGSKKANAIFNRIDRLHCKSNTIDAFKKLIRREIGYWQDH